MSQPSLLPSPANVRYLAGVNSSRIVPLSLSTLCVALASLRLWLAYPALPEIMASHFGVSGEPDAYQSKSMFALTSSALNLGLLALFVAMPWCMRKLPNATLKRAMRGQSPEQAQQTLQRALPFMDWLGVATLALLAAVFELVLRANLHGEALEPRPALILVGLFGAFVLFWSLSFKRALRAGPSS